MNKRSLGFSSEIDFPKVHRLNSATEGKGSPPRISVEMCDEGEKSKGKRSVTVKVRNKEGVPRVRVRVCVGVRVWVRDQRRVR